MNEKEFGYHSSNECIYYKNPNGDECYIYVGDSWNIDKNITIEQIEKDFDSSVQKLARSKLWQLDYYSTIGC